MDVGNMTLRRWRPVVLGVAFWTLPALVFATQNYSAHLTTDHPLN